jgi:hypothetical protein
MKSQLEKNQTNLKVTDIIFYADDSNCEKWEVTELFEGGFEAKGEFETKDFMFSELQIGWSISSNTMENNKQNYRTIYE